MDTKIIVMIALKCWVKIQPAGLSIKPFVRYGIGLQGGFSWALGREPVSTHKEISKSLPKKPEAEIILKNL